MYAYANARTLSHVRSSSVGWRAVGFEQLYGLYLLQIGQLHNALHISSRTSGKCQLTHSG